MKNQNGHAKTGVEEAGKDDLKSVPMPELLKS
jgi:hypothetical protein